MARNKFNAKTSIVDGIKFASEREYEVYLILKDRQNKGEIINLRRAESFLLQERFLHNEVYIVNKPLTKAAKEKGKPKPPLDVEIKQGKQREIGYTADFVYEENGKTVVVEVKSWITAKRADYPIRRKLYLKRNPDIKFVEYY